MMKKLLLLAALLVSTPAMSATSSSDLETLAKQLEQNTAGNSTLNSKLLSLLREPALTLYGWTLPTTAAQYTTNVETAWKLRRPEWFPMTWAQASDPNVRCVAMMADWNATPAPYGLKMETFGWGKGNCASVTSAAIARMWAHKLRQIGR